jgi:hypothetical protein
MINILEKKEEGLKMIFLQQSLSECAARDAFGNEALEFMWTLELW